MTSAQMRQERAEAKQRAEVAYNEALRAIDNEWLPKIAAAEQAEAEARRPTDSQSRLLRALHNGAARVEYGDVKIEGRAVRGRVIDAAEKAGWVVSTREHSWGRPLIRSIVVTDLGRRAIGEAR